MAILCSFPGRYGDIAWSLPTCRAISQAAGAPVDLLIAGEFASMIPALKAPYLGSVRAHTAWSLTPPDEWCPPTGSWLMYDRMIHLGYRGWPDQPLPQFIYAQTQREYPDLPMAPLDLETPWLTVNYHINRPHAVVTGWSECHFELKYGMQGLVDAVEGVPTYPILPPGRWAELVPRYAGASWELAADLISSAQVFLGDCSALHVLACALGIPVLLYEPMTARHNSIFYPFGKGEKPGDRVFLVTGNDGKPTTDSRHTADAIRDALKVQR